MPTVLSVDKLPETTNNAEDIGVSSNVSVKSNVSNGKAKMPPLGAAFLPYHLSHLI